MDAFPLLKKEKELLSFYFKKGKQLSSFIIF